MRFINTNLNEFIEFQYNNRNVNSKGNANINNFAIGNTEKSRTVARFR